MRKIFSIFSKKREKTIKILDTENYAKIIKKHRVQEWFIYSYENFNKRFHAYSPFQWICRSIDKNRSILATGCGTGDMLYHLSQDGFVDLSGYDYDIKVISAAQEINSKIGSKINFFVQDGTNLALKRLYDVIIGINWIYHVENYSLDDFFKAHVKYLSSGGCFVFDVIDKAYNGIENNQYNTQDWGKDLKDRRKSEYLYRYDKKDIEDLAKKYSFNLIFYEHSDVVVQRSVYVLKKNT